MPAGSQEAALQTPEQGPAAVPEIAPRPAAVQPAAAGQAAAIPIPAPSPSGQAADDTTTATSTPATMTADDDNVEKEWVNKARQIVERTRNDPYRQSEELTLVKADYMRQRYNKIVKVNK